MSLSLRLPLQDISMSKRSYEEVSYGVYCTYESSMLPTFHMGGVGV